MASLLFSFILIYDHPRITRGVKRLGSKESTIAPLYNEVAPRVAFFGQLVGKSLEAQVGARERERASARPRPLERLPYTTNLTASTLPSKAELNRTHGLGPHARSLARTHVAHT